MMIELINKLMTMMSNGVEYIVVSVLIAMAALLGMKNIKYGWKYILSSIIMGGVFGLVAHSTPLIADFSYIASMLGTLAGPATLAALQHKTLMDLYKIYVDLTDKHPDIDGEPDAETKQEPEG